MSDEEVQEARERGELLQAARNVRGLLNLPGWELIYKILAARPAALAAEAMASEGASIDFLRGRYAESTWLLKEIDALLKTGRDLVAEQVIEKATEDELRRELGGGGGELA